MDNITVYSPLSSTVPFEFCWVPPPPPRKRRKADIEYS